MILISKSVNYYLIDGDVTGRVKCTFSNWTGIAYRIPRTLIKQSDIPELTQSGVYMLFGVDDATGKDVVYIGQAGDRGVRERLLEHYNSENEDYWFEAIVFTSSNNFLGQTDICYLEHHLYKLAIDAKRYEVKNNKNPSEGNYTDEKGDDLKDYMEFVKVLVGVLGHKVFVSYDEKDESDTDSVVSDVLSFSGTEFKGTGQCTREGFVVFQGSKLNPNIVGSYPKSARTAREKWSASLKDYELTENVLLSSPYCAACFLAGYSVNGKDVWKNKDGKSLKEIEGLAK